MRCPHRLLALSLAVSACAFAACATTTGASPGPGGAEVLPFIEDDYGRALAEAKQRHLPLFVDAWAPWCHSCRFLKAYVFTDPSLAKHAGEFVWLSIDTEKPQNAAFQEKFPIEAWPTLLVIDPEHELATFKWLGSANAPDLERLLDDAVREQHPDGEAAPALAALAEADGLEARGDHARSSARYRVALASDLPPAERDRALASLLGALQTGKDLGGCVQLARERVDGATDPTLAATLAATGLDCALELEPQVPGRTEAITALEAATRRLLTVPGLNADDRSSLYETLCGSRQQQGDSAGAKELAAAWLTLLQGEAAKATTPAARSVFDPHTVNAALALGEPEKALPALEQSERDLPNDYNAAARIASVQKELGHFPEALAASDRALAKVYGPRTLRVLEGRADISGKMGDTAKQKETLDRALAFAQALPPGQRSQRALDKLLAARAALGP